MSEIKAIGKDTVTLRNDAVLIENCIVQPWRWPDYVYPSWGEEPYYVWPREKTTTSDKFDLSELEDLMRMDEFERQKIKELEKTQEYQTEKFLFKLKKFIQKEYGENVDICPNTNIIDIIQKLM